MGSNVEQDTVTSPHVKNRLWLKWIIKALVLLP